MLSPALLFQLLDHAHDGLLAFDTDFRYTLWNAEMERITGVPRDKVLGAVAFDLFPFLKETGHDRVYHDALAGRTTISRDRPFAIGISGKQGFFDSTHAPLLDAAGNIVGGFAVVRDITDIKQKTAQAARAEECFQKLVEQAPLSIQTYAPDGRPLSGNPAWERLFGVTHADIATHFNLLTDPQMNASGIMPLVRRAFAGETVTTPPIRFVPDRGIYKDQERWAGAIFYPVKDEQRNVERVVLIHNDVTETKRHEDKLKLHSAVLEHMTEGVSLSDENGIIVWTNPAEDKMFGYAPGELVGLHLSVQNPYPPDENQRIVNGVIDHLKQHGAWTGEFSNRRKDGTPFPTVANVTTMQINGKTHWLCVQRDVTPRKRAEEALRHSQTRLQAIFDTTQDAILLADDSGRFVDVNPAACEMTGYARDELLALNVFDLTPLPAHVDAVQLWKSFRGAGRQSGEFTIRRHDGSTVPAEYRAVAHVLPGLHLFVLRDVTERKRAEQELHSAKVAAEKASSAKDDFLAVLSHELRTPLTPVLLSVSLLQNHRNLPDDVREDLATIRQNVELEARLIDDLLDLTRVARGLLHLNPAPLDVHLLLRGTIALCFPDDAINLVTTDLAATRHHVFADPARLQQVFWNLLNNARKFTPPTGRITVRTSDDESDRIRIDVTDTGIGIAPQLLPKIFDAFVQGDAEGKKRGGLGLGLAIAKAIVTAHEGTIFAHSEGAGRGATFTIDLATVPAPTPTKPTASAVGAARATSNDTAQPLNILLVEDNQPTLDVLQRLLTALGHRVTPASTVEAALARAAENDHDLIISDIGLPDGTGYDLMRSLRATHDLPGIALSGYGMEDDVQKSLSAGFTEHLTKPIDLQTLERSLSRLTSTR